MDLTLPIAVAAAVIKTTGFDIAKALGIRPKGSNDTEYNAAVARDLSAEYDKAQAAVNSTTDSATQQRIVEAYNAEKARWGDLNNPSRNVALGAGRFAAEIDSIMASAPTAATATATVPAATESSDVPQATIITANNQADTIAEGTSAASNAYKIQPSNPLLNYMPLIITSGAIVLIAIILLKEKGK